MKDLHPFLALGIKTIPISRVSRGTAAKIQSITAAKIQSNTVHAQRRHPSLHNPPPKRLLNIHDAQKAGRSKSLPPGPGLKLYWCFDQRPRLNSAPASKAGSPPPSHPPSSPQTTPFNHSATRDQKLKSKQFVMMMHTSASRYTSSHCTLPPSQPETISISIALGNDRSSSIVLPRGHDLVKHLERLIPTVSQPQTQQLMYSHQPKVEDVTAAAARFNAGRALSSLSYQQSPQYQTQTPTSTWSQFMHPISHFASSPAQAPSPSTSLTSSPLYHSDQSKTGSARVYHHTQKHLKSGKEPHTSRPRYRRSTNSGSSKRCQVVDCDKISVSRGLCRGHGGGRRCQYVGCCKGAQSRSDLCWAHGGGQRCHVKGCLRSRKSKLYCVAHVDWDSSVSAPPPPTYPQNETLHSGMQLPLPKIVSPARSSELTNSPRLPSLLQALSTHTRNNFHSAVVSHGGR